MKTRLVLLVLLIICISCGTKNKHVSDAQKEKIIGEEIKIKNQSHWLQFRGDGAMGVAPDSATPPTDFGTDKNVLWKIETPEGFSSPCICEDNLIITGFEGEKKYCIWNINRHDGSVKWKKEILVDTLEYVHPVSSPAAATPASDGENIYCYFPPKGLICLDYEGDIIWESAIELGDTGNITLSGKKWKISENVPETPSVLVNNGLLYMIKDGGTVTCVDTESGDIIYTNKLGASGSYLSSPLYANGNIFMSSYNGKITILKEGKSFEIINRIDLGERICASPVALEDKLYVRTASHLYAFK